MNLQRNILLFGTVFIHAAIGSWWFFSQLAQYEVIIVTSDLAFP